MKIFSWLKESNRLSHMYVGFAIYAVLMLLAIGVLSCFEQVTDFTGIQGTAIVFTCTFLCVMSVFIAMCAVEYVQKVSGVGKWDWLDVLAGMLVPVLLTVIITVPMIVL